MGGQSQSRVVGVSFMILGLLFGGLAVGMRFGGMDPQPAEATDARPTLPGGVGVRIELPANDNPKLLPAEEVSLPESEELIAVDVGNKARAYRVKALNGPMHHVVNDLIGGRPVTITYCDRTHCMRVLTSKGKNRLRVATGGYLNGLVLKVEGRFYWQSNLGPVGADDVVPFPYEPMEFRQTTWGIWRPGHLDGEVYVGDS